MRVSEDNVCDGMVEEDGTQQGFEELFKKVKIDSPNLVQMCTQCAIPKPYNLLRDAVSRSLRWNGMELVMKKEMIGNGSQLSKVILILGDIQEEAEAVGVKQATQMASQRLFKKMHPELLTYGSFLEIYGRLDDKSKIDNAKKQHDEVKLFSIDSKFLKKIVQKSWKKSGKMYEKNKKPVIFHEKRYTFLLKK